MVLRPDMLRKAAEPLRSPPPAPAPAATPAPVSPAPAPTSLDNPPSVSPAPARPQTPLPPSMPLGAIQVLTGGNAGRSLDLVKSLTTLGKPGVQVAVIARRPHGYFLTHVEGPRYPQVNGMSIELHAHALRDHDIIELAGVKMEFFIKP